jgi:hypothetical protein
MDTRERRMAGDKRLRRSARLAAGIVLGLAAPAAAQDDPAARLEHMLRDWFVLRIGPYLPVGSRPMQVTRTADGLAVSIPLTGDDAASGLHVAGQPITLTASPLDGTRWALRDIRIPSPLVVTAGAGPNATTTTYSFDRQTDEAEIDPTFATPSTWTSTVTGYAAHGATANGAKTSYSAAESRSRTEWRPSGPGRVDMAWEDHTTLAANTATRANAAVSLASRATTGRLAVAGIAADQALPLQQAVMALIRAAMARAADGPAIRGVSAPPKMRPMTPAERSALDALVEALGAVTGSVHEDTSAEDLHVAAPHQALRIGRLETGFDAKAVGGQLQARMRLALEGLDTHEIAAGTLPQLRPHRIEIAQSVSGVSAARLHDRVRHAIDSSGNDPHFQDEVRGLLIPGTPLHVGLDALLIDLDAAKLSGSGAIDISADGVPLQGHAHLVAEGLDAVMQAVRNRQAVPFLAMLKGFGKQDGPRTVWDIDYGPGRLTVNGSEFPLPR